MHRAGCRMHPWIMKCITAILWPGVSTEWPGTHDMSQSHQQVAALAFLLISLSAQ